MFIKYRIVEGNFPQVNVMRIDGKMDNIFKKHASQGNKTVIKRKKNDTIQTF